MTAILSEGAVCDGYDVRCLLSSGERLTFSFPSQPADVPAAVDALEASHLAFLAAEAEQQIMLEITPE
jgi:hypothetical protein